MNRKILPENKRNRLPIIYRPAHPEEGQNKAEKSNHRMDIIQKSIYGPPNMESPIEYNDYINVLDMTLNNPMARLQPWSFGKCAIPLHCHCVGY